MAGLGGYHQVMNLPVYVRKNFIHEFIEQKEKEHKQMESERRKARSK